MLQTNTEGRPQFLIDSDMSLDIEISSAVAWSGSSADLAREEVFHQSGAGFVRSANDSA